MVEMAALARPLAFPTPATLPSVCSHRRGARTVVKSCVLSSSSGWPERSDLGRKGKRVFFLDVNPLCYRGSTPSLHAFAEWMSLFFSQVSLTDPVIAVIDGEGGNDTRRQLLASYKAHRKRYSRQFPAHQKCTSYPLSLIADALHNCHVPVVRVRGFEADDVVATLSHQVLDRGLQVVIASPDKDFKQLVSEKVQIVMPMPEFGRWSFYTLKHYIAQYGCEPSCDLSLRSIIGDDADGVPGIQNLAPGFGRKTALKLIKKHGSLDNLLNVAAIRTVGKPYAQDALTKHADYLRRNYQVLCLKRDVEVQIEEEWLCERNSYDDLAVLTSFVQKLSGSRNRSEVR